MNWFPTFPVKCGCRLFYFICDTKLNYNLLCFRFNIQILDLVSVLQKFVGIGSNQKLENGEEFIGKLVNDDFFGSIIIPCIYYWCDLPTIGYQPTITFWSVMLRSEKIQKSEFFSVHLRLNFLTRRRRFSFPWHHNYLY